MLGIEGPARDERRPVFQRLSFVQHLLMDQRRRTFGELSFRPMSVSGRAPLKVLERRYLQTDESDTFKTIGFPRSHAHASCFNCHWEAQEPTKDECDGCHLPQTEYAPES